MAQENPRKDQREDRYRCEICEVEFRSAGELQSHEEQNHSERLETQGQRSGRKGRGPSVE